MCLWMNVTDQKYDFKLILLKCCLVCKQSRKIMLNTNYNCKFLWLIWSIFLLWYKSIISQNNLEWKREKKVIYHIWKFGMIKLDKRLLFSKQANIKNFNITKLIFHIIKLLLFWHHFKI